MGACKDLEKKTFFDERNPPPQQEKIYGNSRYLSFMYILLMYNTRLDIGGWGGGAGGNFKGSQSSHRKSLVC